MRNGFPQTVKLQLYSEYAVCQYACSQGTGFLLLSAVFPVLVLFLVVLDDILQEP